MATKRDEGDAGSEMKETRLAKCSLALGTPLRASSPSLGNDGGGDGHHLRTVCSLFSPISTAAKGPGHNPTYQETPPPSSCKPALDLDSFLSTFDKDSSSSIEKLQQLPCDPLIVDSLEDMSEFELRNLVGKFLIENMGLRKELQSREKRIQTYKGQMLAILDWKADDMTEKCGGRGGSGDAGTKQASLATGHLNLTECTSTNVTGQESDQSVQEVFSTRTLLHHQKTMQMQNVQEFRVIDEVYGFRRSLSFIHDLANSIDVDQEQLKHKFKDGCYLTNQVLIGAVAGWMSALFVKKFGKVALSATGGGLLLLIYSARKGYVNVNYDSIYDEISKLCGKEMNSEDSNVSSISREEDDDEEEDSDDGDLHDADLDNTITSLVSNRVKKAKKWIASHTYTVGGFVLSFVYNIV